MRNKNNKWNEKRKYLFSKARGRTFVHSMRTNKWVVCLCAMYLLICVAMGIAIKQKIVYSDMITSIGLISRYTIVVAFLGVSIFIYYSKAILDFRIRNEFEKIGFHNHLKEYPQFLWMERTGRVLQLYFFSNGIHAGRWEKAILELENIFDITINSITMAHGNRDICIKCCRGRFDFDKKILWKEGYLQNNALLILGEGMYSQIKIDLANEAHILIGGTTGSGKTWLLKHLLLQCIQKNYEVIIADFKGGIDYPHKWYERCVFLTKEEGVASKLKQLVEEIVNRRNLFVSVEASNIDEYNRITTQKLPRMVFACDELAELLDCTGIAKEEKEKRKEIVQLLATIARIGRAYGIHLFLCTQRPDADIVPGQIKNNMPYRVCGKADDVLSRIVLDNTDAHDKIPIDSVGMFVDNKGNLFKGYYVSESMLDW